MKKTFFVLTLVLAAAFACHAQEGDLLIDGYEVLISGGPEGTVDYGAGNGSVIDVSAAEDLKQEGRQSLKVAFDAVSGGYMYVARGFDLDAKNAGWVVSNKEIDWSKYSALAFNMYGSNSKVSVAVDVKDNGGEMWRYLVTDDFTGWKRIICPFDQFFARSDWQPESADKNGAMDFPLKNYQFEPLPVAKGVLYFDLVELVKKK